ncbi:uncharacterized protein LOC125035203 [Penaeus chinensis]|uniref:uncharacterized protein LOC125035203 n=1 Tax=Penaeus chinensis TaxID=139456 RepID=UPI001FB6BCB9|nr:uncharacterized protein LOC125035203 [Penaeus chinensis]
MDSGEDGKVSLEGAAAAVAAVANAPCALLAAASHAADAVPLPQVAAAGSAHRGAGGPLAATVSLPAAAVAALQPEADPEFHWGRRQILSLIAKVEDFFEDFYDGTKKKKMIWKAVAERMRSEGHNCTGAECDKKWRNLKGTYVKVLQKQIHGDTSYRFEYFDALHHILGKEIDPLGMREQAMSRGPEEEMQGPSDYHEITVDGNFVWTEAAVHLLLDLVLEHRGMLMAAADDADEPWEEIAHQMGEECQEVQGCQCQRKWLNLQEGFRFHQAEAEVTASVPLWPYFTRVRHVMMSLSIPTTQAPVDRKPILGLGGAAETPSRKPRGAGLGGGLGLRTPSSSSSAGVGGAGRRVRGLAGRVRQLEGHTSLSRRLDHLEARVETSRLQREAYRQTNSILTKVLAELRRINGILEEQQEQHFQPSHHLHAGGGQRQQHHDQEPGSPNQGIIIVEAYDQL